MRILIVTQYFWPENFKINDLAFELKNRGYKITVLTGLPNYPDGSFFKNYSFFKGPYKEEKKGVEIIRVPILPRKKGYGIQLFFNYLSFALFASIYALLKIKNRFDKIFVFEISPITVGLPAIIIKNKYKLPIYFWVLDLWPESVFAASKMKKNRILIFLLEKLVRYIYKNCNYILVSSKSFVKSIKSRGINDEKIKYLPNWAEDVFLNYKENKKNDLPRFPNGFNILYAGNIGEAQDFENVIKAIKDCTKHELSQKVNWVFIGDGRKRAWLEQEIRNHDLSSYVYYFGKFSVDDVPYFYANADALFVSLNDNDIFKLTVPAKIQTYMAAKKPILAMLSGEGKKIIENSYCGYVSDSGKPKELVFLIKKLLSLSDKERNQMGLNGYEFYLKNFNKNLLINRLIQIFEK